MLQTLPLAPTGLLHTDTSQIRWNLQLLCPSSSSHNLKWMKLYLQNRVTCAWTFTVSFIISVFISHRSVQWRWLEHFYSHNINKLFCQKLCRWEVVNNAVMVPGANRHLCLPIGIFYLYISSFSCSKADHYITHYTVGNNTLKHCSWNSASRDIQYTMGGILQR